VIGNAAPCPARLLGRYSESDLLAMFADAGVLASIAARGFHDATVEFDASLGPLTHTRLLAAKEDRRHLLLDTCLTELRFDAEQRLACGYTGEAPLDVVVVYWLREQDPTASFDPAHERLPLQEHPGLGVLKLAFRVALQIARDLDKQGIAALPKFFHDAAIFYRSRLFLFLDPREQGRFEALLRDLSSLSLRDATLALLGSAIRDDHATVVGWQPGLQVMPLSPELTGYFHANDYQVECRRTFESSRFVVDAQALLAARAVFERSLLDAQAASS